MTKTKRILSLLLLVSVLASLPAFAFQTIAADITNSLTIEALADGSSAVVSAAEKAIGAGTKDSNGVYYAFKFPSKFSLPAGMLGAEEYTLMAATALYELNDGSAKSTSIDYIDISFSTDEINCGSGTTLTKGQYLDLAERASKYGNTLFSLPTSFNRPSDGTSTYDGRISIYSLVVIFARALDGYKTTGTLPDAVTFLPTHVSGITLEEPATESTSASTSATTKPTTAPTSATTAPTSATTKPTTASTATPTKNTLDVIALEGKQVEDWIKTNYDIPNYCTLATGEQLSPAQMLYIFCKAILDINNGKTNVIYSCGTMDAAPGPNGDQTSGTIKKAEYIDMATRLSNFMDSNGHAPNYCTSATLGTMQYEECLHFFAKIMSYYYTNKKLPDSMKSNPWGLFDDGSGGTTSSGGDATFGVNYSAYSSYLISSTWCQSKNATIISVAKTGMKYASGGYANPTSTYQAMYNLFEYLNSKMIYDYYYDTQKGALKSWTSKYANCCDHAHLMNACARSLGVPGRYVHGYCRFSSGLLTGHVWSEVLCGTSWKTADLVSDYNYLGYKTSTTLELYNRYATLPF